MDALGAENVTGVSMPSPYSSRGSIDDARALARNLGIKFFEIPITDAFRDFKAQFKEIFKGLPENETEENMQPRLRGMTLMALSNKFGHLLLTTGNKSELAVGYCTLYGDMCGGLAVISDVPKTMIYRLARWLNRDREIIPAATIEKPPDAGGTALRRIAQRFAEQRDFLLNTGRRMRLTRQMDLPSYLTARTRIVDRALDRHLPSESTKPHTIHKAMRYSIFAGGKRLR